MTPEFVNEIKARRVIAGSTYNTATSELLAYAQGEFDKNLETNVLWEEVLYRTRGGAYFTVERSTDRFYDRREGEWIEREKIEVTPLDHAAAVKWVEEYRAEIVVDFFELPPDGDASTDQKTRLLRMGEALNTDLEALAKAEGISVNEFILRAIRERVEARKRSAKAAE